MRLKSIAIATLALTLVLGACKYEEGPGISLRTKRDRVANEWRFDSYVYDGADLTNQINTADFELILNMYRTNDYGLDMVKPLGNGKYETTHTGNGSVNNKWNSGQVDNYLKNLPSDIKSMMHHGLWNFDRRHFKIQIHTELSYDDNNTGQVLQRDWTIVKLKEKELKVWGVDANDKRFDITFKPINDEPYWF